MNIGLLCGSLGERSSNAAVLRVAGARVGARGHAFTDVGAVGAIPPFDPKLAEDPPPAIRHFCEQVRACDALLIAAPEYAGGLAGSTKNALDWLVGDSTIYRKVIGVASAGTTGGRYAIDQLVRTISWQGGWIVDTLGIAAPRAKSAEDGSFTDETTRSEIETWVDTVVGAVDGSASQRLGLVTAVVVPFGIDPARFGEMD